METGKPKKTEGVIARREKRLALRLLSPTFLLVIAIVIFPLFANFWISFKPISLADLRAPTIFVKERIKGNLEQIGEKLVIEYRYRNSSMKYPLSNVSFSDILPDGVKLIQIDPPCAIETFSAKTVIKCDLGAVEPKARGRIILDVM